MGGAWCCILIPAFLTIEIYGHLKLLSILVVEHEDHCNSVHCFSVLLHCTAW